MANIRAVASTPVSLPNVLGQHIIATIDSIDYRIACAGSGRWTVSGRGEGWHVTGTLELSSDTYTYAVLGSRATAGTDWKKLLSP